MACHGDLRQRARRAGIACLQIAGLWLFCLPFQWGCARLHCPVPGSLIAMVVLWVMLAVGIVKERWIGQGGDLLLRHMLLFFVPAAAGIVQYGPLLRTAGWRLGVTVAVSTALVMAITGLSAEAGAGRKWRAPVGASGSDVPSPPQVNRKREEMRHA